jgi:hypothetical protein
MTCIGLRHAYASRDNAWIQLCDVLQQQCELGQYLANQLADRTRLTGLKAFVDLSLQPNDTTTVYCVQILARIKWKSVYYACLALWLVICIIGATSKNVKRDFGGLVVIPLTGVLSSHTTSAHFRVAWEHISQCLLGGITL